MHRLLTEELPTLAPSNPENTPGTQARARLFDYVTATEEQLEEIFRASFSDTMLGAQNLTIGPSVPNTGNGLYIPSLVLIRSVDITDGKHTRIHTVLKEPFTSLDEEITREITDPKFLFSACLRVSTTVDLDDLTIKRGKGLMPNQVGWEYVRNSVIKPSHPNSLTTCSIRSDASSFNLTAKDRNYETEETNTTINVESGLHELDDLTTTYVSVRRFETKRRTDDINPHTVRYLTSYLIGLVQDTHRTN